MTNKMPEVGKRYRNIQDGRETVVTSFGSKKVLHRYIDAFYDSGQFESAPLDSLSYGYFFEDFEELPNQEAAVKKTCEHYFQKGINEYCLTCGLEKSAFSKTETTDSISKAKEELKERLSMPEITCQMADSPLEVRLITELHNLKSAAQNLLNALDEQNRQESEVCCPEKEARKEKELSCLERVKQSLYDSALTPEQIMLFEIVSIYIDSIGKKVEEMERKIKNV